MRTTIMDQLFARMERDASVFFLTADMGINLVERFAEAYPGRYLNVGIAEQNLIGVCAGLCNAGFRPVAYTISNFLTHRCFEQIRNDVALHEYPVTLLGTHAGFDMAPLGPTHHIIDDWGTLAGLPGIEIFCPSSVAFADGLIDRVIDGGRPTFIRMPKSAGADLAEGSDIVYRESRERSVLLVSYGAPVTACLDVARLRPDVSVLVVNRLKPLTWADIGAAFERHDEVVVVEDHRAEQGLYGIVCRLAMEARVYPAIRSLAPSGFNKTFGISAEYFAALYRLDAAGIEATIATCAAVTL